MVPAQFVIKINGKEFEVNAPNANSHFEHVNLLGADFCSIFEPKILLDYENKTATMSFPPSQQE
jgi:hypothetical protein